jgi:hypothetical protein
MSVKYGIGLDLIGGSVAVHNRQLNVHQDEVRPSLRAVTGGTTALQDVLYLFYQ